MTVGELISGLSGLDPNTKIEFGSYDAKKGTENGTWHCYFHIKDDHTILFDHWIMQKDNPFPEVPPKHYPDRYSRMFKHYP